MDRRDFAWLKTGIVQFSCKIQHKRILRVGAPIHLTINHTENLRARLTENPIRNGPDVVFLQHRKRNVSLRFVQNFDGCESFAFEHRQARPAAGAYMSH